MVEQQKNEHLLSCLDQEHTGVEQVGVVLLVDTLLNDELLWVLACLIRLLQQLREKASAQRIRSGFSSLVACVSFEARDIQH